MKNTGKIFEDDLKKSIPDYVMITRLKDSSLNYNRTENSKYSTNNPYDFLLWDSKHFKLYALELKTVNKKLISFERTEKDKGKIHYHQINGLKIASSFDGVVAGFVIEFRECRTTIFIEINNFIILINSIDKKSFNLSDLENSNIDYEIIEQHIKRTRYSYDMDTFFNGKEKKNEN